MSMKTSDAPPAKIRKPSRRFKSTSKSRNVFTCLCNKSSRCEVTSPGTITGSRYRDTRRVNEALKDSSHEGHSMSDMLPTSNMQYLSASMPANTSNTTISHSEPVGLIESDGLGSLSRYTKPWRTLKLLQRSTLIHLIARAWKNLR